MLYLSGQIKQAAQPAMLSTTTGHLFQSVPFLEKTNLNMFRMLASTCKALQSELMEKDGKGVLPPMLQTLIRYRPEISLTFSEAKYRFSLQINSMAKFCAALPKQDKFHVAKKDMADPSEIPHLYRIRFVDAYRLASDDGLKAAMDRRHRFETKIMDSAHDILQALRNGFMPMRNQVKAAITELKNNPRKNEKTARKGLRLLDMLDRDIVGAEFDSRWLRSEVGSNTPKFLEIQEKVTVLKGRKKTLVTRYKAHAKYCPALMTKDCLAMFA